MLTLKSYHIKNTLKKIFLLQLITKYVLLNKFKKTGIEELSR